MTDLMICADMSEMELRVEAWLHRDGPTPPSLTTPVSGSANSGTREGYAANTPTSEDHYHEHKHHTPAA